MLGLYKKGKTDKQVAKILGISVRSIVYWRAKHPSFKAALAESKSIADDMVEASLFQRAIGYTHPEEKVFQFEGSVVTHKTQKHYPPDTQAAQFWLKNRRPKKWREKNETDLNFNDLSNLTDEQLQERLVRLKGKA